VLELDIDYTRAVLLGKSKQKHVDTAEPHSILEADGWCRRGFEQVARVELRDDNDWNDPSPTWLFVDQHSLFAARHAPWVYFITRNNIIVKVGETNDFFAILNGEGQPRSGTAGGRMGRLGRHKDWARPNDTDMRIRRELKIAAAHQEVAVWANPIVTGEGSQVIESKILKEIKNTSGSLPWLNYMCK